MDLVGLDIWTCLIIPDSLEEIDVKRRRKE